MNMEGASLVKSIDIPFTDWNKAHWGETLYVNSALTSLHIKGDLFIDVIAFCANQSLDRAKRKIRMHGQKGKINASRIYNFSSGVRLLLIYGWLLTCPRSLGQHSAGVHLSHFYFNVSVDDLNESSQPDHVWPASWPWYLSGNVQTRVRYSIYRYASPFAKPWTAPAAQH